MEDPGKQLLWEIAFYAALGMLVVLFLVKKYRQARAAEKNSINNNQNNQK